jgi:hypothetical protein
MDKKTSVSYLGQRRLNHVEFAHRPGESSVVIELFEALGCKCTLNDTPDYGLYIIVDLDGSRHGNNDMFVSEAEPEQLAFEEALRHQLKADEGKLAEVGAELQRMMIERPYRAAHVGLRLPSIRELDETVARLNVLAQGSLKGRLRLGDPMTRSAEESETTMAPMKQLWIWTDVVSTGLLAVGQQIELQAYET